jgi:hypothetical protein
VFYFASNQIVKHLGDLLSHSAALQLPKTKPIAGLEIHREGSAKRYNSSQTFPSIGAAFSDYRSRFVSFIGRRYSEGGYSRKVLLAFDLLAFNQLIRLISFLQLRFSCFSYRLFLPVYQD